MKKKTTFSSWTEKSLYLGGWCATRLKQLNYKIVYLTHYVENYKLTHPCVVCVYENALLSYKYVNVRLSCFVCKSNRIIKFSLSLGNLSLYLRSQWLKAQTCRSRTLQSRDRILLKFRFLKWNWEYLQNYREKVIVSVATRAQWTGKCTLFWHVVSSL